MYLNGIGVCVSNFRSVCVGFEVPYWESDKVKKDVSSNIRPGNSRQDSARIMQVISYDLQCLEGNCSLMVGVS